MIDQARSCPDEAQNTFDSGQNTVYESSREEE
jgi:hypothetical protein